MRRNNANKFIREMHGYTFSPEEAAQIKEHINSYTNFPCANDPLFSNPDTTLGEVNLSQASGAGCDLRIDGDSGMQQLATNGSLMMRIIRTWDAFEDRRWWKRLRKDLKSGKRKDPTRMRADEIRKDMLDRIHATVNSPFHRLRAWLCAWLYQDIRRWR